MMVRKIMIALLLQIIISYRFMKLKAIQQSIQLLDNSCVILLSWKLSKIKEIILTGSSQPIVWEGICSGIKMQAKSKSIMKSIKQTLPQCTSKNLNHKKKVHNIQGLNTIIMSMILKLLFFTQLIVKLYFWIC